jgi:hypothetical protein
VSDSFDVDTTFRRGNDNGTGRLTVQQDGEIVLVTSIFTFTDIDSVTRLTLGTSLLGDQVVTKHLFSEFLGFFGSRKK